MNEWFSNFSSRAAKLSGSPIAFAIAAASIVIWIVSGPIFRFSDTWQLVINTGTTIVTFLMVFLIQHAQNRDTEAIHLKIDELIRATGGARNTMIDLDRLSEKQLAELQKEFQRLCDEGSSGDQQHTPCAATR